MIKCLSVWFPPLASHTIASWHLNRHINAAVTQDIARSQELASQVLDLLGEIGRVGHHQAPAIKQTALDSMRAHVPQVRRSAIRVLEAVVTRGDSVSIDVLLDTCAHTHCRSFRKYPQHQLCDRYRHPPDPVSDLIGIFQIRYQTSVASIRYDINYLIVHHIYNLPATS